MAQAYLLLDFCRKNRIFYDRAEINGKVEFTFKNLPYPNKETFNKESIDNFIKENNINAEWDEITPRVLRVEIAY